MDFSIVTPSLNMLEYLKLCHASIADQRGASVEHIVMDGGSTDGSVEWLSQRTDVIAASERDNGMYDAINKGIARSRGNIVAYLNCDEQYLPGTLQFIKDFSEARPDVDVFFGNALIIKPDGSLIAYRKAYRPRWPYIASSHLYILTCAMFFRRTVFTGGLSFDESFQGNGDMELVIRLLRDHRKFYHCRRYMAVYTWTGRNMSAGPNAAFEKARIWKSVPRWIRAVKYPLNLARLIEKMISGAYWERMPLEYAIFDSDDATERTRLQVRRASFRWPR